MKNSKIDRALHGPSLFEVTLGAILSVALGLVLAFVFLVLKPVETAKSPPKEDEKVQGAIYYIEGGSDPAKGRQWIRKRQTLLDGTAGEIVFNEDELNSWISSSSPKKVEKKPIPKPLPAKPGAPAAKAAPEPEPVSDDLLSLDVPNVRIRDSIFQIGVPGSLNLLSISLPVVLQAQGTFQQGADMWVFKPDTIYLGSMPLHRVPGLTDLLMKRLVRSNAVPDDALAVWKKVSHVALEGRTIKLTLPAAAQ